MQAASIKGTFGSILGTVSTTATTITSTIEAAGEGSAMLLAYARHHRSQQAKDYALLALNGDYIASTRASNDMVMRMRETAALNLTAEEQAVWQATFAEAKAVLAKL